MDFGIAGRVAIVTGATGGLGRAAATLLSAEGARVALFARTQATLKRTAAEISAATGHPVLAVAGDMSRTEDVSRLIDTVTRELGKPSILICVTGRPPRPRQVIEETGRERWVEAFNTCLMGAVNVISAVAPHMIEQGWGRIVSINTASVKQPMHQHGLSTIFRTGLAGYLKHLANETAHQGVTVNVVGPGSIGTDTFMTRPDAAERGKTIPVGRLGKPEECAAAAVFFCSQQAGFITGTTLQVDGGMTATLT